MIFAFGWNFTPNKNIDCHLSNIIKLGKKAYKKKIEMNYIFYIRWMMFDDQLFNELELQGLWFWKKSTLHIVKRK
jgi:hypothetical protein